MTVYLTRGQEAIIDAADVSLVSEYLWKYQASGYAARNRTRRGSKSEVILLHRVIMNAPEDREVDHKDGNGLNNRRANLSIVTHAENHQNRKEGYGRSGVRGVHYIKRTGRWQAKMVKDGKTMVFGSYATIAEAEAAIIAARSQLMPNSKEARHAAKLLAEGE